MWIHWRSCSSFCGFLVVELISSISLMMELGRWLFVVYWCHSLFGGGDRWWLTPSAKATTASRDAQRLNRRMRNYRNMINCALEESTSPTTIASTSEDKLNKIKISRQRGREKERPTWRSAPNNKHLQAAITSAVLGGVE